MPSQKPVESPSLPLPQKRKLATTEFEIPDSEGEDDEDYGWAEEDEVPPMPPQWQGSEDILVPPEGELEGDDEGIEDEEVDEGGRVGEEDAAAERVVEDSEDELA